MTAHWRAALPLAALIFAGRSARADEAPPPSPVGWRHAAPLQLSAAAGIVVRNFSYSDPVADASNAPLVPHENQGAFVPSVSALWFPAAGSSRQPQAHVGLGLEFQRSLAGNTSAYGQDFDATYQQLLLDICVQIPWQAQALRLFAGGGQQRMLLSGDNQVAPGSTLPDAGLLPDMRYDLVRAGAAGIFELASVWSLQPELSVRLPRLGGQVGELTEQRWFPNATALGFEAKLRASAWLSQSVGVFTDARYLHYGIQMQSQPESAFEANSNRQLAQSVAGGANDDYVSVLIGVELHLGSPTPGGGG